MADEFEETMQGAEEELEENQEEQEEEQPRMYAGKFKTPEDLEKGYLEVERMATDKATRAAELERERQAYIQQPVQQVKKEEEPEFESEMEKKLYYQNKDLEARLNSIQYEQTVNAVDTAFDSIETRYKDTLDDSQKRSIFAEAQNQTGTIKQRIEKAYKLLTFDTKVSAKSIPVTRNAPNLESPGAPSEADPADIIDARGKAMLNALGVDPKDKDFRKTFRTSLSGE